MRGPWVPRLIAFLAAFIPTATAATTPLDCDLEALIAAGGAARRPAAEVARHGLEALTPVTGIATDKDPRLRRAAVHALAALPGPEASAWLASLLYDPDPGVATATAYRIAELGAHHRAADLAAALKGWTALRPNVAVALLEALTQIGDSGHASTVRRRVADPDDEIAIAAVGFLARHGDISSVEVLTTALRRSSPRLAALALEAIDRALDHPDFERTLEYLESGQGGHALYATIVSRQFAKRAPGDPGGSIRRYYRLMPHLLEAVAGGDFELAIESLRTLHVYLYNDYGFYDDSVTLASLARAVESQAAPAIRRAIVTLLGRALDRTILVGPLGYREELPPESRRPVQVDSDAVVIPALITRLADRDRDVRTLAIKALQAGTGRDFGYSVDDDGRARDKATRAWKRWWRQTGGLSSARQTAENYRDAVASPFSEIHPRVWHRLARLTGRRLELTHLLLRDEREAFLDRADGVPHENPGDIRAPRLFERFAGAEISGADESLAAFANGWTATARDGFSQLIELHPDENWLAIYSAASELTLDDSQQWPAIESALLRAINDNDDDVRRLAHFLRGRHALRDGRPRDAVVEFGAAQLDRTGPRELERAVGLADLALAAATIGDHPLAASSLVLAATLTPDSSPRHIATAELAWSEGRLDDARTHLNLALDLDPISLSARDLSRRLHQRLGATRAADRDRRIGEASRRLLSALQLAPSRLDQHTLPDAELLLAEVGEIDAVTELLGRAALVSSDPQLAASWFECVSADAAHTRPFTTLGLGLAYEARGNPESALAAYRRAADHEPALRPLYRVLRERVADQLIAKTRHRWSGAGGGE